LISTDLIKHLEGNVI